MLNILFLLKKYTSRFKILKLSITSLKSMFLSICYISHSIDINDKLSNVSCSIVLLNLFLIRFNLEKERSPLQLVTIMLKNILNAISTFGNVSSILFYFKKWYIPNILSVSLFSLSTCSKYSFKCRHSISNTASLTSS